MPSKVQYSIRDKENTRHKLWLRIIKLINALLITVPFALCWYHYYAERLFNPFYARGNRLVVALFLVLYILFGRIYSGFIISLF